MDLIIFIWTLVAVIALILAAIGLALGIGLLVVFAKGVSAYNKAKKKAGL